MYRVAINQDETNAHGEQPSGRGSRQEEYRAVPATVCGHCGEPWCEEYHYDSEGRVVVDNTGCYTPGCIGEMTDYPVEDD